MKKIYCDCCQKEICGDIDRVIDVTIKLKTGLVQEYKVKLKADISGSDICKYCYIDAINQRDDRPQVEFYSTHKNW